MNKIILVSGPPGVGKSSLARQLVSSLNDCILLDKDLIDEAFSPGDRGEYYSIEVEPKVIKALLNLAKENLLLEKSVVLDLPWTHILIQSPEWKLAIEALAKDTNAKIKVIELYLDEDSLYKRIKQRGLKRDQAKLTNEGWASFKNRDHINKRIELDHLALDSSLPLKENISLALNYIKP